MKIAFVYDVMYPYVKGGVEKRIWELAVRLAARGNDVHVIGMKYWPGADSIVKEGVVLHGICSPQTLYTQGRRNVRETLYFSVCLLPFLLKEEFDLIDCQQFPYFPCFSVKLACLVKKKPFIITWHEVWGNYWYDYLGWIGVFGKVTERAAVFLTPDHIAVSHLAVKNLHSLGICRDIPIIPNGISPGQIASVPPAPGSRDLIFAGRLIREKHVDLLVLAFSRLTHDLPDGTLLILGEGPEKEEVQNLINTCASKDRISFQPFCESHDQVISLMKSSRVCVIPSTREGFGIAALEALACGLPVVTIDHPDNAIRELITGGTGFLCALSEKDLADKIRLALNRHQEMKTACRMSTAGYDWDRIVVRLESHYQSLISR
jgi:L-malate glycosyltransferase